MVATIACATAQNIPTLHDEAVEASKMYMRGNAYQRDMLLYVDMLGDTHPYYADARHRRILDSNIKRWYRECGKIEDVMTFRLLLQSIASPLHDGHTVIAYWNDFGNIYPFGISIRGNDKAVVSFVDVGHADHLGKGVVRMNGLTIEDFLDMARPMMSADNDVSYQNSVGQLISFPDFWRLLGYGESLEVELEDGVVLRFEGVARTQLNVASLQQMTGRRTSKRPVLFDYDIDEEAGICYMQFNQFADRITHPQYSTLPRFDYFVRDMMADIAEKGVKTLVVDMQYNGGGNSSLGSVLLSWLKPINDIKSVDAYVRTSELLYTIYPQYRQFSVDGAPLEMGEVYSLMGFDHNRDYKVDYTTQQDTTRHVLNIDEDRLFRGNVVFVEGRESFSSASLTLTLVRDNNIGIIVGEKSAGRPCHYGDVLYALLPNTSTTALVSHKYFIRPNRDLEAEEYIVPDVEISLNDPHSDLLWEWIVQNYSR